jgi:transposase-like protein
MQMRSRAEWVELVRRFNESGESQTKFASGNGLKQDTLGYWVRKLRRQRQERAEMLPVRVIASTAPEARERERNRAEIAAELADGLRLRFPRGTKPQVIAGVISRLR